MLPVRLRRRGGWPQPFSEIERLFDRALGPWWSEGETPRTLTGAYPVDIREEDGRLVVDAEMPGLDKNEIDVSIEEGVLHITAERKAEEPKGTTHLNERRFTRVERSFSLPGDIDESEIKAKLESGVLHLEMPRPEPPKPKQVEIE